MQIFLTTNCCSFTGSLGSSYGYYIKRHPHKDGTVVFHSQRSKHPPVPPNGHLRFIFACAEMAQKKICFQDIAVSAKELRLAFNEARLLYGDRLVKADAKQIYNAGEVLDLKNYCK